MSLLASNRKFTKQVVKVLNDWNKPRFTERDAFCKVSWKMNRRKIDEFALLMTEGLFRPLIRTLGENSDKPLVAVATGKTELMKLLQLTENAKLEMEAIDTATSNEELFEIQLRLRGICAALVDESVRIMNLEGTPFELKKQENARGQ